MTLNAREREAISLLFHQLAAGTKWKMVQGTGRLQAFHNASLDARLDHVHLAAQGNVVSAVGLLGLFSQTKTQPLVIFYGCAGTQYPSDIGRIYLLAEARYLALSAVSLAGSDEKVSLKNKWIANTGPAEDGPLPPASLRGAAWQLLDLQEMDIREAVALSTDATVAVPLSTLPTGSPTGSSLPLDSHIYSKGEWTYGEALAYSVHGRDQTNFIIDMESYGIARAMEVANLLDRVLVLRVTTDALTTFNEPEKAKLQQRLLNGGLQQLSWLIRQLLVAETGVVHESR